VNESIIVVLRRRILAPVIIRLSNFPLEYTSIRSQTIGRFLAAHPIERLLLPTPRKFWHL
jgi:hypothetical protein